MGEDRLILFDDLPNFKNFMEFWCFFLTQGHMGLEIISKRNSTHSFHPISANIYSDIAYHVEIQVIIFLGNRPRFTKIVPIWNFNVGVMGKS